MRARDRGCVDCGSTDLLRYDHVPDYEQSRHTVVDELELRCAPCHHKRHAKQKAAEAALRFQAALVSHVTDAIIATTDDGIVTSWNPAAESIYGKSAAQAIGQTATDVVGATLDPAAIVNASGVVRSTHHHANGSALAIRVSAAAMDGGFVLVCTDQTALRKAEAHFTTVVSGLEESVLVVGQNGTVISANPAALRLLESLDRELVDEDPQYSARPLYDADGNSVPAQYHPIALTFRTRRPITGRVFGIDRADGERVWLEGTCSLLDPDDPLSPVLASFSDITEKLAIKQRLEYEATHDPLTGLANRTFVLASLGAALDSPDPRPLAIAFIDLDDFKVINDSLGHNVGDKVLAIAAQRIRGVVRRNDLVGRLGGDEFIALLLDSGDREDTDRLIKRIREALIEPISAGNRGLHIDASIGIVTVAAGDSRTAEDLLRDADIAMYQAKKSGPGRTEYFTTAHRS